MNARASGPWALALAMITWATAPALAQSKTGPVDFGQREFTSNCASCHGPGGKGDGPLTDLLTKSPPDLTRLAARNGGILPIARLYEVIDGTGVAAHGSRDMPVWGRDYRIQAAEQFMEAPYDPEAYTRGRILALLEYINRLQGR
jgi:mono/diheme cytochrome c family protein